MENIFRLNGNAEFDYKSAQGMEFEGPTFCRTSLKVKRANYFCLTELILLIKHRCFANLITKCD